MGTPKTGNTWIKHLLSDVYQLPIVELGSDLQGSGLPQLGPRWIGQQHYDPSPALLDWAKEESAVFVAPVRHPADVLVSLRHYMVNRKVPLTDNPLEPAIMLHDGPGEYGDHTLTFLQHGFPLLLHLSIRWLRGGWAHSVRYRDLWRFPLDTLRVLTQGIIPVPDRTLVHALCACEVELMRATVNPGGDLVRKGGINSWVKELPPRIKEHLARAEPYVDQFKALGYTMDERDPDNSAPLVAGPVENPFRRSPVFGNGVPISPFLIRLYFDLPLEQTAPWSDATSVEPGSYYTWLRSPAAADPQAGRAAPKITELAMDLRSRRPDLMQAFGDPFGADRITFCHWFVYNAMHEFSFDRHFTMPVLASWAAGTRAKA